MKRSSLIKQKISTGILKSNNPDFVNLPYHMNIRYFLIFNFCFLSAFSLLSQPTDTSFKAYEQSIPGSSLKFKMIPIKGGSFIMGSPENENGREADEGPQKRFTVSPFWMGAFEVTHDEFDIFF